MTIRLIFCFLLITYINAYAQDHGTSMQKTIDTICNCLGKISIDTANHEAFKEAAMNCFTTVALPNYLELAEERHIDITDEKAMQSMGLDVGKELIRQGCQPYLKFSGIQARLNINAKVDNIYNKTFGKLTAIENKDFRYIILKDKDNRKKKFIWLSYFDGSDKFQGDKIKNYIGKNVVISWKELEVYLPSVDNYLKIKQITAMKLEN